MKTYKGDEPFSLPDFVKGFVVPIQPHLAEEIREVTPDLNAIAYLVMKDPGLSGEILNRIGGSVNGQANIWDATQLLGIDAVIGVVNGLYLRGVLEAQPIELVEDLWSLNYDIARASVLLTRSLNLNCDVWDSYTLGLFHHASMPLLFARQEGYLDVIKTPYATPCQSLTLAENEHCRTNHAVISYMLAKR